MSTTTMTRRPLYAVLASLLFASAPAFAQHEGHAVPEEDPHAGHVMPEEDDPHAGHVMPEEPDPHAGHVMPEAPDPHAGHVMPEPVDPHAGHVMPAPAPTYAAPREPIPAVTPADRAAAFPEVAGHAVHDKSVHWFVLLDRLETWDAEAAGDPLAWETLGWVGTDLDRLWVRSEGEAVGFDVETADVELFYGRAIARWWDGLVGIRHEFGEGPSRTSAAIGVIGLAPLKFEVEATAYIGERGHTSAALGAEYETLLTNRLILQWLAEAEFHGKDDPQRGIGSGLATVEGGLRLRYEFTRKIAPYVGVAWERAYGRTADFRIDDGEPVDDTRVVFGFRTWF